MNKLLLLVIFISFVVFFSVSATLEETFDINDVENKACQNGCETENVRNATRKKTYEKLYTCNKCIQLFELCIQYRTCKDSCVPSMPVLPYKKAQDMTERIRPPINPCLDLVSACNFETMDSFEILRSENPFLYI